MMSARLLKENTRGYFTGEWKIIFDDICNDFEEYKEAHPEYAEPISAFLYNISVPKGFPYWDVILKLKTILEDVIGNFRHPNDSNGAPVVIFHGKYHGMTSLEREEDFYEYVAGALKWGLLPIEDVKRIQESFYHYGLALPYATTLCVWFNRSIRDVNEGDFWLDEELSKGWKPVGENPFLEALLHIVVARFNNRFDLSKYKDVK